LPTHIYSNPTHPITKDEKKKFITKSKSQLTRIAYKRITPPVFFIFIKILPIAVLVTGHNDKSQQRKQQSQSPQAQ
jgi:hypothetical protein